MIFRYHEHRVVDDVPNCQTIKEYKCELVTKGYTKEEECKEWPVQKCTVTSELVKKVTPETSCHKEPKPFSPPGLILNFKLVGALTFYHIHTVTRTHRTATENPTTKGKRKETRKKIEESHCRFIGMNFFSFQFPVSFFCSGLTSTAKGSFSYRPSQTKQNTVQ